MNIETYIINDIHIQPVQQSLTHFKELFNKLTYSHIPLEDAGNYIGCIGENDIRCFDPDKQLSDYAYAIESFYVRPSDHWLEIYEAFARHHTNIMPVLKEKTNTYLGYIELSDVLDIFNTTPFLNEPGAILIVEKGSNDYSFSEICQIIESNQNKLLGAFLSNIDGETAQVTLKTNLSGLNEIIQSLRRFGYKIVSSHQEDAFLENLKERSAYLDKYLNI